MAVHLCAFVLIAALCWIALGRGPSSMHDGRAQRVEAKTLLAVTMLYVMPLPVAAWLMSEGGNLSDALPIFAPWLPAAIWFTAAFLVTFTVFYLRFDRGVATRFWATVSPRGRQRFRRLWLVAFAFSAAMLQILASDVGGLPALVLSGYRVTELFVGQGHFAIAIEWLISLCIVLTSYAIVTRQRRTLRYALGLVAVILLALLIMGRRGMVGVVLLALVYLAIEAGWLRRPGRLLLPGMAAFLTLNWLGLVRGESYRDVQELAEVLYDKTSYLVETGELFGGLFYTLTTGNFVVPFETLPQLMRHLSYSEAFWLGGSFPRGVLLLVPNALFPERPLPLANWYMSEFYGAGAVSNEGRQFFFLSEAYLNFGWLGFIFWGIFVAFIISRLTRQKHGAVTYWGLAFRALAFGSLLNFVASDTTGFMVSFLKGFGLVPCLFALFARENVR